MRRLLFRADASVQIGTGHIMRCLAIARYMVSMGNEVYFICKEIPDYLTALLKQNEIYVLHIERDVQFIDEPTWILTYLKQNDLTIDWIVIDHYKIDKQYESKFREKINKIMVIDDLADREHDCDLLLDQNSTDRKRYTAKVNSGTICLLGPDYALLRDSFMFERQEVNYRNGNVANILVCFGGSDPTSETTKCLRAIRNELFLNIHFTVIIGEANQNKSIIREMCDLENITLYLQVNDMEKKMREADLAICSAGTITWERYCMGLPAIVIAVADNQLHIAQQGEDEGIDQYLGPSSQVDYVDIEAALSYAIENPSKLHQASRKAMMKVDAIGVRRVAEWMIKL